MLPSVFACVRATTFMTIACGAMVSLAPQPCMAQGGFRMTIEAGSIIATTSTVVYNDGTRKDPAWEVFEVDQAIEVRAGGSSRQRAEDANLLNWSRTTMASLQSEAASVGPTTLTPIGEAVYNAPDEGTRKFNAVYVLQGKNNNPPVLAGGDPNTRPRFQRVNVTRAVNFNFRRGAAGPPY